MRVRLRQRLRLRLLAAITIADTGVISYLSTRNLAERFGFGPLSWLYPLCLDAAAAVGMDLWLSRSPAQRPAKWLALTAVALSLAANVADWAFTTGGAGAAILGAIPPLMLAALLLVVHSHESLQLLTEPALTSLDLESVANAAPAPAPTPVPEPEVLEPRAGQIQDQPPAVPALAPVRVHGHQPGVSAATSSRNMPRRRRARARDEAADIALANKIRAYEREHGPLSRRIGMGLFNVGAERWERVIDLARSGQLLDNEPNKGGELVDIPQ